MAIFSLHHGWVGRTTHRAGTAAAHVRYITRRSAARLVLSDGMPSGRRAAATWLDQAEASDRANARVCDRIMVALPIELDELQRAELVRRFASTLGGGRASWLAAIHDRGRDAGNPHAHIVFRDKDRETGRRVFGLSAKGSTDRLRLIWEQLANAALRAAGSPQRVSRLSLAAQGLQRPPQRHRGPRKPLQRAFNAEASPAPLGRALVGSRLERSERRSDPSGHGCQPPERAQAVKDGRRPPPEAARSVLDGRARVGPRA